MTKAALFEVEHVVTSAEVREVFVETKKRIKKDFTNGKNVVIMSFFSELLNKTARQNVKRLCPLRLEA